MKRYTVTDPLVDIVMLVHDKPDWADLAIRAVESHTKNKYRLIIVDMASVEEETHQLLRDVEARGHTVIHLGDNRSFSHGVNAGVMTGSAKFIVILNDDALVTDGWDTAMLTDAADKSVGLVGAKSNYAAGAQGMGNFVGEPPYLVFVCVCLRRQVWDTIGPMDGETFDGFSSEDLDYSWRVRKAGLHLKLSQAYVLHAGSQTLAAKVGDAEARQRNDQKYADRLHAKWGAEWVKTNTLIIPRIFLTTYHAEEWTRVKFMGALQNLRYSGGYAYTFYNSMRAPIHVARQAAADYALDNGFDYIAQLDDDATFPPDTLQKLLGHQKEVVTSLAYTRKVPFSPCIFKLNENNLSGDALSDYEGTGLRQVDVSGFHVSIIKTSVFKKLRDAGIKQFYGGFENKVGEDFALCLNLKKIGVPVYCDTDLQVGHIGEAVVVDQAYRQAYVEGRVYLPKG